MSQIAVRLLEAGGVNSLEDSPGVRTFIGIARRETAVAAGCRPFENRVDNKCGARDDMSSRYICADIANVAQIGDPEKRLISFVSYGEETCFSFGHRVASGRRPIAGSNLKSCGRRFRAIPPQLRPNSARRTSWGHAIFARRICAAVRAARGRRGVR